MLICRSSFLCDRSVCRYAAGMQGSADVLVNAHCPHDFCNSRINCVVSAEERVWARLFTAGKYMYMYTCMTPTQNSHIPVVQLGMNSLLRRGFYTCTFLSYQIPRLPNCCLSPLAQIHCRHSGCRMKALLWTLWVEPGMDSGLQTLGVLAEPERELSLETPGMWVEAERDSSLLSL